MKSLTRLNGICFLFSFILLFPLLATSFLFAQTGSGNRKKAIFNLSSSVPVPRWVNQVDWEHPNVYKIDALIKASSAEETHARTAGEEEDDEEPYEMAYSRWRKMIEPFIHADGSVVEQPGYYNQLLKNAIGAQTKIKRQDAGARMAGSANWTVLGPMETFTESNAKVPWQTNIYSIAIAPSNPNVLYAGCETGALFRSADKGLHWISISDALPRFPATSIAVDPGNANIVYATSQYGQLIKSTNGGADWTYLTAYNGGYSEKIVINRATGRILLAGDSGVVYSKDSGMTWHKAVASQAVGPMYDVEINSANPNLVYAVGVQSRSSNAIVIFRSTNGGDSLVAVNAAALSNVNCHGARFGVTPANGNTIYCINLGESVPVLFKSTDAGISWNVAATGNSTALPITNHQGFYDLDILVSPNDDSQLITGTKNACKSVDGGVTFTSLNDPGSFPLHPDIQCMRALGNDAYITTDGGVSYSTDFFSSLSNCSARNYGLTGSDFWGFAQGWDQDIVVGGRYHNGNTALFENYGTGNGLSVGGAESATGHVFHGQKNTVGFNDIGTKQIPSSLPGKILEAPYGNTVWPMDFTNGEFIGKLMVDPCYSNTFYVGRDSVLWKSGNHGLSYTALHIFDSTILRFDIARSNPNVMYACTGRGVYRTADGGSSWIRLGLPAGITYNYYAADIAVDQLNENIVFLCISRDTSAGTVLKSTNGGATWVNYSGMLIGKSIEFIIPQAGTHNGVYVIKTDPPAKVYYRDSTMTDWTDYSAGLPQNFHCKEGGIIFYRDSKLRLAGTRGIWESPLYSIGRPVAQPMADKRYVACTRDTVNFTDYSNVAYAGATWKWRFPGASYISDTTAREPKVLYPSTGDYTVSLEVTDASGNKHARTIEKMITVLSSCTIADTVAGKCLKMDGSPAYITLGNVNINSNHFSISCWMKPDGLQKSFSQLIAHDAYPSSGYGFGLGFPFKGYTPSLELCYTDSMVGYGNYSGLIADSNAWNFVVLTYSPTGVTIYLNGVPSVVNNRSMPVIDLSRSPFYVSKDIHRQGGAYKGAIDEIKFYNYALSQNEVREKMHLIQRNSFAENGLLKYFQFNQYDSLGGIVPDLISNYEVSIPNKSYIVPSTAPVATGSVFRNPMVNAAGQISFPGTGVDLYLKSGATYPNGEVVAFQLNSSPDQTPDSLPLVPKSHYFIIENYGANKTFTTPDSIRFSSLGIDSPAYRTTDFNLYNRPSRAWGATWGSVLSRSTGFSYAPSGSSITYGTGNNITGFGQFALSASPLKSGDTVAGKCLQSDGSTVIDLGKVNINSDHFSMSCWMKPDGLQKSFSQLLAHDPYPGSGYGFGLGFAFNNYTANTEVVYTDNLAAYWNSSGLIADTARWNFVVLTYSPTGVTIYLNGVPAIVNSRAMPAIDLSQSSFYVNKDIHGQGGAFRGAIDEIKFYNYTLSQSEVREKMHLIQKYPAIENGLLKYFQFNQYNSSAGTAPDLMGNFAATIPGASSIVASTAPVATGSVFRNPTVTAAGQYSFPGTGVDLYLKSGATYPNGEVVAFQLNSAPDQTPGMLPLVPRSRYFIIDNYGTNKTFTAPDSIRFSGLAIDSPAYRPTDFHLYNRPLGAWGATWGSGLSQSTGFNYAPGSSSVTYSTGNNITGFGQFALSASPLKSGDTVAGKCLQSDGSTVVDLGKVNINSDHFSMSCWMKPDGLQKPFSQLLAHDPYPGSGYGFGLGFAFQGNYNPNTEVVYTDNIVGYLSYSGLIADTARWNFVVLTYSPTGVTIYLNGVPAIVNNRTMPVIDLSQTSFYINKDIHAQGGAYKGAIDEIKFYDYTLSQNEVREKMHLIQKYPGVEKGLLKYFQFNQYNSSTGTAPDLMSDFAATIPTVSSIVTSTAPVATGSVFRNPNVSTGGQYSFPGTGIDLYLKNGATYPSGEVVAFQLNSAPDQRPGTLPLVPASRYFIINNYGANKTFTAPDSIRFSGLNLDATYSATGFHLFKRPFGAWGATWGNELSQSTGFSYASGNSCVSFGSGNNVTGFGQFALSASLANGLQAVVTSQVTSISSAITTVKFYPNPNRGWGYLNIISPHSGHAVVSLQDINGNIVYQTSEQLAGTNKTSLMLNLGRLTSGTYILNIRFNTGEWISKKVIIIK